MLRGRIDHALRVTFARTREAFVLPAGAGPAVRPLFSLAIARGLA